MTTWFSSLGYSEFSQQTLGWDFGELTWQAFLTFQNLHTTEIIISFCFVLGQNQKLKMSLFLQAMKHLSRGLWTTLTRVSKSCQKAGFWPHICILCHSFHAESTSVSVGVTDIPVLPLIWYQKPTQWPQACSYYVPSGALGNILWKRHLKINFPPRGCSTYSI